ncbi:MAG: helix-turn-helix domain-containing protein, partial [Bacteroides sp.]|nr:helix-turn-helix domain-containing protein [Bacteroides sp.]
IFDIRFFRLSTYMKKVIPKFDIPTDFIVGTSLPTDLLKTYGMFPCCIKVGAFVYCKKANIRATINVNEHKIKDNDFITLTPETFIQVHEIDGEIELFFALFSSGFLQSINFLKSALDYLPVIMDNPIISLTPEMAFLTEDYFKLLLKADQSTRMPLNEQRITGIYHLFMREIQELYKGYQPLKQKEQNRSEQIYKEFIYLIMKHYKKEHSVQFYAEKLGLTLQHFSSTIKKASGRTPHEAINQILIIDAKAQLKTTELPIKEIAMELGFSNHGFFNKFFKQHVEMTPQEYRNGG